MRRKSTTTILKEARALLARRRGWIQGDYADADGSCFCSMGALYKAALGDPFGGGSGGYENYDNLRQAEILLEDLVYEREGAHRGIISYNDATVRTKRQILSLFDRAIQRSEKR